MYPGTDGLRAYENNLADLYIGHDMDRQLRGNMGSLDPYNGVNMQWYIWRNALSTGYRNYGSHFGFAIDCDPINEYYKLSREAENRAYWWHQSYRERQRKFRENLYRKLAPKFNPRVYASGTYNAYVYLSREVLRKAIHGVIKQYGDPRRMPEGSVQKTNVAALLLSAVRDISNSWQAVVSIVGDDTARRVNTQLSEQADKLYYSTWIKPIWHNKSWYLAHPLHCLHACHVSTHNPEHVAYTQSGDKLMRDIQTATKPGKYLMQFYGPGSGAPVELTEEQVREWANRYASAYKNDDLFFVANTDPDGWEWVYENGSGFSSCMQYNHPSNRYLSNSLHGDNHPVRIYANKHNDLALAYIGDPLKQDGGRVYGRAIVNTKRKEWVRLYGDDRLKHALQRQGYKHNSACLHGQVLTCKEFAGGYIMPYLDGDYCNVSMDVRDEQDVFVVDDDGDYNAQQSSGLMGARETCPCCGDAVDDEDGLTYVEDRGESICDDCLRENYKYATGLRGNQDWHRNEDCIFCESDNEYYVESYANYNDVYQCAVREYWYNINDMETLTAGEYDGELVHADEAAQLSNGEWCLATEVEELQAELDAEDEDETEEESVTTMTLPAADETFSLAA